jgi:DNA-binding transcriptional regulator/RsmH inhibitor MraZ
MKSKPMQKHPLYGYFEKKLDSKRRLIIPSQFIHSNLQPQIELYILMQEDKNDLPYLHVSTLPNLETELLSKGMVLEDISPITQKATIDSQTRILIKKNSLEHISQNSQYPRYVHIFGRKTHFDIYSHENSQKVIQSLKKCLVDKQWLE